MIDEEFDELFGAQPPAFEDEEDKQDPDRLFCLHKFIKEKELPAVRESLKREIMQSLVSVDSFVLENLYREAAGLPFSRYVNQKEFSDLDIIRDRFHLKETVKKRESHIEP